jgi:DNA-binding response OmpR family regulator/archaellum biogenesis ATPase FlaH
MLKDSGLIKIRSGNEIIENQLGGMISGKTYLVHGEPGTGKSLFGLQFLNEGLLQGERCGLITQEDPKDLLTMGGQIGFQWEEHLESNRLFIIRYSPNFPSHFAKSFDLGEVFNELNAVSGNGEIKRLVFDPITPVVDCVNRLNYTKVFTELFQMLERTGSTSILTLDELSGVDSTSFLRTLISLSFGVIQLKISSDLVRKMFFQKMKYQVSLLHPAAYTIEPGKGIVSLDSNKEIQEAKVAAAKKRILLADGDRMTCDGIQEELGDTFDFTVVHDGLEALTRIVNNSIDLIILDTALPKIDGFELCQRIRSQGSSVPVFFISGKRKKASDRIMGFDLGGDEYMSKPLNFQELQSRVQAVLRRGKDYNSVTGSTANGVENGDHKPYRKKTSKKRGRAPLSSLAFNALVEKEIEKAPSDPFTLVSYRFKGVNGKEGKKLIRISSRTLNSLVRKDDVVGYLGNGTIGIFLKGANSDYSDLFKNRVRRRIREAVKEKMEDSCPAFRIMTGSAVFPADGRDAGTVMTKAFGSKSFT